MSDDTQKPPTNEDTPQQPPALKRKRSDDGAASTTFALISSRARLKVIDAYTTAWNPHLKALEEYYLTLPRKALAIFEACSHDRIRSATCRASRELRHIAWDSDPRSDKGYVFLRKLTGRYSGPIRFDRDTTVHDPFEAAPLDYYLPHDRYRVIYEGRQMGYGALWSEHKVPDGAIIPTVERWGGRPCLACQRRRDGPSTGEAGEDGLNRDETKDGGDVAKTADNQGLTREEVSDAEGKRARSECMEMHVEKEQVSGEGGDVTDGDVKDGGLNE